MRHEGGVTRRGRRALARRVERGERRERREEREGHNHLHRVLHLGQRARLLGLDAHHDLVGELGPVPHHRQLERAHEHDVRLRTAGASLRLVPLLAARADEARGAGRPVATRGGAALLRRLGAVHVHGAPRHELVDRLRRVAVDVARRVEAHDAAPVGQDLDDPAGAADGVADGGAERQPLVGRWRVEHLDDGLEQRRRHVERGRRLVCGALEREEEQLLAGVPAQGGGEPL